MNMFNVEVNNRFMIGEGWCPSQKLRDVKNTFKEVAVSPFNNNDNNK